jgi:hypothetical protein
MSAARRLSLVTMLMTCFVLAFTASAARAQMGSEPTPQAPAPAPSSFSALAPASESPASSLEALRLGLPLQLSASLAAYRWFETAIGQLGNRQMPAVSLAAQRAARSAWWRRRS